MVVSSIKPIHKSVAAYGRYIFGDPHNGNKVRNLAFAGIGEVEGLEPRDMLRVMKLERDANPSKRRSHDAYTGVVSFSEELDPSNPADVQKSLEILKDVAREAYPGRSVMIAMQADGKGGHLHGHLLINNVDGSGKALRATGWRHLKKSVDEVSKRYGLTPLTTTIDNPEESYDWRRDLAKRIGNSGSLAGLADAGISFTMRHRKRDDSNQMTFKFTDSDGKTRRIRGGALASQLGWSVDIFEKGNLERSWLDDRKLREANRRKSGTRKLKDPDQSPTLNLDIVNTAEQAQQHDMSL